MEMRESKNLTRRGRASAANGESRGECHRVVRIYRREISGHPLGFSRRAAPRRGKIARALRLPERERNGGSRRSGGGR